MRTGDRLFNPNGVAILYRPETWWTGVRRQGGHLL